MPFTDGGALLAAVGTSLGHCSWRTVSIEDVASYRASVAGSSAPPAPPAPPAEPAGPAAVVPGGLTVGLAAVFVAELLDVAGYVGVDYGLDRVRFPAPLAVGAPVRARGLLVGARCEGDAVRTVVELTYETDDGGGTPCVAHVVTLLLPR